jgi:hypothetical protein
MADNARILSLKRVDWIRLTANVIEWQMSVNTIMNFRHTTSGGFLSSCIVTSLTGSTALRCVF